ncbi:MAG TPA: glucosaminidase domain-containing protein, partial [Pseudomonadales bacterium]|nr:glucosaminidase domain-containing protein [Pseudomonadales bacterium]
MKRKELVILPLGAVLLAILFFTDNLQTGSNAPTYTPQQERIPDFSSFRNVKEKKRHFFDFMVPRIRHANANVLAERKVASKLSVKVALGKHLSDNEKARLQQLFDKYRVRRSDSSAGRLKELLFRVDTVPASLMLAQSATESAWGTSRFAREGNNFFGIWCFSPGCGITPKYRDEG